MAATDGLSELARSVLERVSAALPSGPIVVALSGGADSAVAAWAAALCSDEVRVVHVDHGFAASLTLADAARAVASRLELEIDEVAVQVPPGASPEGHARDVRQQALIDSLKMPETLVSGHTADDQAETILGNVIRGTGTSGLAGIPPRRDEWVRPLLQVTRDETRRLAAELGLPFVDDPQNDDLSLRRNQLRHQLIPHLEDRFNPQLRPALRRLGYAAAADDRLLEHYAASAPVVTTGAGDTTVPAALVQTMPPAVATRVVRRALRRARGPHGGSSDEIEAVLAVAGGALPSVTLGDGLEASREGPLVVLHHGPHGPAAPIDLVIGGITEFGSWCVTATAAAPPQPRPLGRSIALLNADALVAPVLRPVAEGESIEMADGHKEVRRALAEAGVPARLRIGWPVVVVGGEIAWLVAVRPATWAMAKADSADLIRLTANRSC
ncbi:MAG: tRNA lysidine(34) synthetase TilS [Acidimicrobiia bacterium]|nr:tRNA lysidine(34) synthetase TilS [Acidimicrobiia bacterium]